MKGEAGVVPMRRLLAVDTGARVSVGRHRIPTKEPFSRYLSGPKLPRLLSSNIQGAQWEQLPTRPNGYAWGLESLVSSCYCKTLKNGTFVISMSLTPLHPYQPGTRSCSEPVGNKLLHAPFS